MATIEDLHSWMERDLRRGGGFAKNVEVVEFGMRSCSLRIYTDTNRYGITARDPDKMRDPDSMTHHYDDGYLGCVAACRKPRAGEDWTRGNDLADGPLTEDTWRAILADIVSYELVKVHKPVSAPDAPST